MLRSMYSGISGLKNFQTKLDVIGNNIANVNTHGFKKGRTIFKDLYSQTVAGASAATQTRGGVNAKQVGLGAQLGAIDTIHAGGSTQFTGNTLDLAIEGDGFFVVAETPEVTGRNEDGLQEGEVRLSNEMFTRAGNFYMDNDGYIVNQDGKYLLGFAPKLDGGVDSGDNPIKLGDGQTYPLFEKKDGVEGNTVIWKEEAKLGIGEQELFSEKGVLNKDVFGKNLEGYEDKYGIKSIKIPTDAQTMSIGNDGLVTFVDAEGTLRVAGQLVMAKFPNAGGLEKTGANYFTESANSGSAFWALATKDGMGVVQSGSLEMSNVDLGEEFTEMIVAQRGFQANTRIITTSDEILQELVNLKR